MNMAMAMANQPFWRRGEDLARTKAIEWSTTVIDCRSADDVSSNLAGGGRR